MSVLTGGLPQDGNPEWTGSTISCGIGCHDTDCICSVRNGVAFIVHGVPFVRENHIVYTADVFAVAVLNDYPGCEVIGEIVVSKNLHFI